MGPLAVISPYLSPRIVAYLALLLQHTRRHYARKPYARQGGRDATYVYSINHSTVGQMQ